MGGKKRDNKNDDKKKIQQASIGKVSQVGRDEWDLILSEGNRRSTRLSLRKGHYNHGEAASDALDDQQQPMRGGKVVQDGQMIPNENNVARTQNNLKQKSPKKSTRK